MKKPQFLQKIQDKAQSKGINDKIATFRQNHGYLVVAFFLPFLIFWLMYICMGAWPFGNGSVLVLDLNGQYVYFFEALHNILRGDASYFYSWARSLGGEFIGIYAYYLASPLSYLVALFPSNHLTEALLFIFLCKAGIAGTTMAFYIRKHCPNLHKIGIITMSTSYALCSYMISYGHNTMWMDALMLLPLTIYGCEQLITKGKFKLFVFSLTLTLVSTFYIGWMTCLFLFIYFFYYYFTSNVHYGDNNYFGEKFHFIKSLVRMGIASLTSLLISCFILLPTYYSLTFGKTDFTDPSWDMVSQFDLLELFTQMLPGSYYTVRPEGLPFVYCGVLALILLPIYFMSKKVSAREKIGGGLILAIMVFCMNNSIVDLIFHGFQRPNWLNYRYSFMFIFLVIIFAARALQEIESISFAHIATIGAGIIGLIIVVQTQDYEYIDDFLCIWISILCVGTSLIGLGTVKLKKMTKQASYTVLAALCCIELFGSGVMTLVSQDEDVVFSSRKGYVDFMNRVSPSVNYVQETDTSFYRMEKTVFRNVCDNMALNIRGLSNSTSTLNASVISFLNQMGYSSSSHWSKYLGGTPVSDSLLGIKYIVTDDPDSMSNLYSIYSSDEANDLQTYLNTLALSIAYAADEDINDLGIYSQTENASPFETMNQIVTALLGEEETVEVFKPISYDLELNGVKCTYRGNVYETMVDEHGHTVYDEDGDESQIAIRYYFYESELESGTLGYTLNFPNDYKDGSNVYFFFCSNYPREVSWEFSNSTSYRSGSFFANESDCIQNLGKVALDGLTKLEVTITNDSDIFYIMQKPQIFYYLDEEILTDVMDRLAQGNFVIDDDYSESHLTGTVNVPEGCEVMFTSIPYDEGWNIYVDGEKVELTKTLDSLMSFAITPGEHQIEMIYRSSYMVYGTVLTVVGLVIFAILIVLEKYVITPRLAGKREAFELVIAEKQAERDEMYARLLERSSEDHDSDQNDQNS